LNSPRKLDFTLKIGIGSSYRFILITGKEYGESEVLILAYAAEKIGQPHKITFSTRSTKYSEKMDYPRELKLPTFYIGIPYPSHPPTSSHFPPPTLSIYISPESADNHQRTTKNASPPHAPTTTLARPTPPLYLYAIHNLLFFQQLHIVNP